MLNDLATFTRKIMFFQALPLGLLLALFAVPAMGFPDGAMDNLAAMLGLLVAFLVLEVAWAVGVIVTSRRADRRLVAELERGSREIVEGRVRPRTAVGQVRRRRVKRSQWTDVPGAVRASGTHTLVVVLDVVGDGPPRRVAALVPPDFALGARKQFVSLALHPELPEVAVVDLGADLREVAEAAAADARWRTEKPRSDRVVVGGYLALAAAWLLGLAAGTVLGLIVLLLL